MPLLLGHPQLLLREALQLIAMTDITNKISNKALVKFFIKIFRFCMIIIDSTLKNIPESPHQLRIHDTKLNYFHE
jgi:hypothetical protein